jgi:putative acetyltransferase
MTKIRKAVAADANRLGRIMYDAINFGQSAYNPAQRLAWCAAPHAGAKWAATLSGQTVWLAERQTVPVGFVTLAPHGYIDLAFVAAAAQGQGVFSALYFALETDAWNTGERRLWTYASLMAQPAFEAHGFHVIRHETVVRCGETLARAEMEKTLT